MRIAALEMDGHGRPENWRKNLAKWRIGRQLLVGHFFLDLLGSMLVSGANPDKFNFFVFATEAEHIGKPRISVKP